MPHHRQGFPCCSLPPLPCVPPPIPRRDQPVRLSLTSRPVAAFPNVPAGRLPHSRFRGLLSVHSRCSPHGRWITQGDPFHRSASNDVVTSIIRSDCYRLERQFAGRDSHPLRDGAFPRHTVRNQVSFSRLNPPNLLFKNSFTVYIVPSHIDQIGFRNQTGSGVDPHLDATCHVYRMISPHPDSRPTQSGRPETRHLA